MAAPPDPGSSGGEVPPAQPLREALDGVAEHGAWHPRRVLPQKPLLDGAAPLAHFAEHPTHRLMNEIVGIVPQHAGDPQRVRELAPLDVVKGRDDRNTPL